MGSTGADRRRRWVVEEEIGGGGEEIGGECLGEGDGRRRRWENTRRRVFRRRRWVEEEEIGGGEKIG